MKRFAAIIATLVLACQTALAGVGGLSFCISKESRFSVRLECIDVSSDDCCPSDLHPARPAAVQAASCDDCQDGAISASEDDQATPSGERSPVKSPAGHLLAELCPLPQRLPEARNAFGATQARGPPAPRAAAEQFARTVAFRI